MSGHNAHQELNTDNAYVADPGAGGAIVIDKNLAYVSIETVAAEARSVEDPKRGGQQFTLGMLTDGGDATVTFDTAFNAAGNTIVTLGDAGDSIHFYSVQLTDSTYAWRNEDGGSGVALS